MIDHPFRMPGGIELGLRTSVVRLASGGIWLHSPGPMSEEDHDAVRELGPVEALVTPNLLHHFYLRDALQAFAGAKLYTPPGLAEKLETLDGCVELGDVAPPEWGAGFELLAIEGAPKLREFFVLHSPTRTLFLGDLAFNVQRGNRRTAAFLTLNGAWKRFGPSRLARSFMKDRAAVRASIQSALEWDFDRVVVTHGDVVETGGREVLRHSFRWLLDG